MAEPAIIKLEDPIVSEADETITEITLRPPTLGDRKFLDGMGLGGDVTGKVDMGPWASTAFMAAQRLGDLSPAAAEKLGSADAMKIYQAVMGFIGGSQTIGLMGSPS